jgi:hypothetical protein
MVLVLAIVLLSIREWVMLLGRRKPSILKETAPVWLPEYAVAESRSFKGAPLLAVAFALGKEISGEAELERAQHTMLQPAAGGKDAPRFTPGDCTECHAAEPVATALGPDRITEPFLRARNEARLSRGEVYVEATEARYNGIRRCC